MPLILAGVHVQGVRSPDHGYHPERNGGLRLLDVLKHVRVFRFDQRPPDPVPDVVPARGDASNPHL